MTVEYLPQRHAEATTSITGGPDDAQQTLAAAVARGAGSAEMLTHAREALRADTASLLVLDESGQLLEPVATSGMSARWRASQRVPVGRGFAGRVASTRQTVVLNRVDSRSVVNTMLVEEGLHSLLGVPVQLHGNLLGVLHVGVRDENRAFTAGDVEALQQAATSIAVAMHRRLSDERDTAAFLLQRSLLPAVLPTIEGLDVAARYVPADGSLGGDWYDVFPLGNGRVGFAMGDIIGHGLDAAIVMGRIRSMLRAYAEVYRTPSRVLTHLDHAMSRFEHGMLATVLYAVAEPPYETFIVSNAGHPAPVVSTDRGCRQANVVHDLLLGVGRPAGARHDTVIRLGPGSSLCLFTDGLVERRPELGDDDDLSAAGVRGIMASMSPDGTADQACSRIIRNVLGDRPSEDDLAVLVIKRPTPDSF